VRSVLVMVVLTGCASAGHASARNNASVRVAPNASTSTIPQVREPDVVTLPAPPSGGISWGSRGAIVLAYERRLRQLHFDPGVLDGVYGQDTQYVVTAVDKLFGLRRDGVINAAVQQALERFTYRPAMPDAEGARVEVDLDTQVLTVYRDWQPILITTASTGSGEYFCGGSDGCQYAITPAGHFHFQSLHRGWDNGKLGRMWNPYYFNGGIAVHGLPSVPAYPASHGCVRIPMDIANYFPTLVTDGESVYVLGTAMKPGIGYIGPATTTTTTTTTTVPEPATTRRTTTTVPRIVTTVPHTATTAPHTTTTAKHA
jgi:L,D-transpeptidase catalytic domain/Putative peptidoglycan binding domain